MNRNKTYKLNNNIFDDEILNGGRYECNPNKNFPDICIESDKGIYKTIECAKNLSIIQIICFFFLAALTVGASTLYLEYEKQSKNSVMINSMYIKIISALVLLGTSIFIFKENCSWKQIVGVLVVILGLTLMSSK